MASSTIPPKSSSRSRKRSSKNDLADFNPDQTENQDHIDQDFLQFLKLSGSESLEMLEIKENISNNEKSPLLFLDNQNRVMRASGIVADRFSFFGQSLATDLGRGHNWLKSQSDDGFLMIKYPPLASTNTTVLSNRLRLNETDKKAWFDKNGHLILEPDPLQKYKQLPLSSPHSMTTTIPGDISDSVYDLNYLREKYKKNSANVLYEIFFGSTYDPDGNYDDPLSNSFTMAANSSFLPDLLVHVGEISMENSPLTNREYSKTRELLGWWHTYEEKCKSQSSALLESRIKAIKQQLKSLRDVESASPVMTSKTQDELHETLKKLEDSKRSEDHSFKVSIWNIVKIWQELQSIRQNQGFRSTSVTIHVRDDIDQRNNFYESDELLSHDSFESIMISMTHDRHLITTTNNCPPVEQERRKRIESTRFFIRLFVDELLITETRAVTTDLSLTVKVNETFVLKPNTLPQNIRIEIYQKTLVRDIFVAKLFLPIPDHLHAIGSKGQQSVTDILTKYWFSSDSLANQSSGVFLPILDWIGNVLNPYNWRHGRKLDESLVDGSVTLGITWNKSEKMGNLLSLKNTEYIKATRQILRDTIKNIGDFDDNISPYSGGKMSRLNNAFLKSRNGLVLQEDSFRDFEIITGKLESPRKRISESKKELLASLTSLNSTSELSDSKEKILSTLKASDLLELMGLQKMKHVYDFVREESLPENDEEEAFWMRYLKIRRPLKPERLEKKTFGSSTFREIDLLIHVVRAQNLPTRKTANQTNNSYSEKILGQGLRPFVEVRFKNYVVRTSTSDGTHPHWNETCILSCIKEKDKILPSKYFDESVDHVVVNVFDDIVLDINTDSRDHESVKILRQQKAWLGSFTIPISSIYLSGGILGNFRLSLPKYHFGYEFEQGTDLMQHPEYDSSLQISISFSPSISSHLNSIKYRFVPGEPEQLLDHAEKWQKQFATNHRKLITTCVGTDGKINLVCRYIYPQEPPESLKTLPAVIRYVSKIPYLSDNELLRSSCDLWCNSEQFLQLGTGDEEEHAVLLCNYALFLNQRASIISGRTMSNSKAIFVLLRDVKWTIVDPITGESFSTDDSRCPLRFVGCIFDGNNIWANKQKFDEPFRMDFNTSNSSNWEPFFNAKVRRPMPFSTIQPSSLNYKRTNSTAAREIQALIKKQLISGIEEWRGRYSTKWNRYCSHIFDTILEQYETAYLTSKAPGSGIAIPVGTDIQNLPLSIALAAVPGLSNDYQQLIKTNRLEGFIQDFCWSDSAADIIEVIKNSNVHGQFHNDVEFAVAVSCHPYPGEFYSVWVFVAAVTIKK